MTADMLGVLAPGLTIRGGTIDEIALVETLGYQPASKGYLFAFVKLANGRYAAIWQTHAIIGTLDELMVIGEDAVINVHERGLVRVET